MVKNQIHRFCVAPMMDWTDRHCRMFHRQISQKAILYTEMLTAAAVIHGDRRKLLHHSQAEHPVALQLGGSDIDLLAQSAHMGESYGYDEINLNIGCPSSRVQHAKFGACLMLEPELVRDCVGAMIQAVRVPVTVKCRTGVDDQDEEESLLRFVDIVRKSGCCTFIVHARKAWLNGLSPKQNRDVPPLNYKRIYELKRTFPELEIVINGGIINLRQVEEHLKYVDGVMVGRAAYQSPYLLAAVDRQIYGVQQADLSRVDIVRSFLPYIEMELTRGTRIHQISRHILGLFQGQPGARYWRRHLSVEGCKPYAGLETITEALGKIKNISKTQNMKALSG
ncbi:MAG: tRNA dihydrouridine(20/20a) synthase DusA [Desulfobulbia bacterium]